MSNFQAHTLVGTIASPSQQTQNGRLIFTLSVSELLSSGTRAASQVSIVTQDDLAAEALSFAEGERVLVEAIRARGFSYAVPDSQAVEARVAYRATFLLPLGQSAEEDHDLQRHIIVGHLGADPVQTTTPNGNLVTNFDLAVNGTGETDTTWYRVAAWGTLGETCANYLSKGRLVLVNANTLKARAWTDQNDNLRTNLDLTARSVTFLDRPGGEGVMERDTATPPVLPARALPRVQGAPLAQANRRGVAGGQVTRGTRAAQRSYPAAAPRETVNPASLRRQPASVVDAARQAALEAYEF